MCTACVADWLLQGPVRCLDAAGPWLVSGGQDDQLHIYDVKVSETLGAYKQQWLVWVKNGRL